MKISSTVANYSESQFYRFFYKGNENARISDNRSSMPKSSLITSDGNALSRAIKTLGGIYESSGSSGKEIFNAVKAFASTYNNTLDSSGSTDYRDITNLRKSIRGLSSKQQKELEMIGITIKSSGKLSVDEDTLASSNPARVKKLFSEDSDFMKQLNKYAKRLSGKSATSGSVIDTQA